MAEEDIINFLKTAKVNQPDKFQSYLDYYKTNYPAFYTSKIAPIFEAAQPANEEAADVMPQPPAKPLPAETPSPINQQSSDINNVFDNKSGPVKKDGSGTGLVILNWVAFVFGFWIVPLILLLASKNERVKKHAKKALIVALILFVLGIILVIATFFLGGAAILLPLLGLQ